ncbi:hypothetical protein [Streptomyces virginiae]|uniref:hypothetical protein n=1 Tax=Streptomyces virginiae TaxID=1961 RepID=UPI003865D6C6|nr:hypothetical protein OG253_34170 [Streptomyces virginiae]
MTTDHDTPSAEAALAAAWQGFSTGYRVLTETELDVLCHKLLGHGPAAVADRAARELRSYTATVTAGPQPNRPPAVIMHSATRTTRGFDGDLADVRAGRDPYDVAGYLEARAVSLAAAGDLAVGRTQPWRDAVRHYGTDSLDVGLLEPYYLSDALLTVAAETPRVLVPLVEWLRDRPSAVVRLYALDTETQVFLLWLKAQAGLDALNVDANNPVVSDRWNRKNHIHPTVEDALAITAVGLDADALLQAEQRASEAHRLLGLAVPVLPGYLVERSASVAAFADSVVEAARLLRERYGLEYGCLKPCEAGDGARIVPGIALKNEETLRDHAVEAYQHGDAYLLEAHVDFLHCEIGGRRFIIAPSGHIRGGRVAAGLTLQLMNGVAWEGNVTLTADDCARLGVPAEYHDRMTAALNAVRNAFHGPRAAEQGCKGGLVTGGVDFAVGRIGGVFGDRVVLGAIDFNLSSHGAEYLRSFQDKVPGHVATRVYRPASEADLAATVTAVTGLAPDVATQVVASVAGRWGMVAAAGTSLEDAARTAQRLVEGLRSLALAR